MEERKGSKVKIWFSGFFGLGALVHLIRFLLQVPLTVGSFAVPLMTSLLLAVVFGVISVGLLYCGARGVRCKP